MVILDREGLLHEETRVHSTNEAYCYAEISADALKEQQHLLDRIVSFAFDRLGVNRLEVRVLNADSVGACGASTH